jgi:NAD(P)-dependent dehydrogenase (short-subunit alcohol dehydrogenase family)
MQTYELEYNGEGEQDRHVWWKTRTLTNEENEGGPTPMTDTSVSNMTARTGMSEEKAREYLAKTSPQNRRIAPEEVAAAVVFLVMDINKGITGQALNIDGGGTMS